MVDRQSAPASALGLRYLTDATDQLLLLIPLPASLWVESHLPELRLDGPSTLLLRGVLGRSPLLLFAHQFRFGLTSTSHVLGLAGPTPRPALPSPLLCPRPPGVGLDRVLDPAARARFSIRLWRIVSTMLTPLGSERLLTPAATETVPPRVALATPGAAVLRVALSASPVEVLDGLLFTAKQASLRQAHGDFLAHSGPIERAIDSGVVSVRPQR
jgi:hypothetical protein